MMDGLQDTLRNTWEALLAADVDTADRDTIAAHVRRSREVRSWLDSFDVRCVRRTAELAARGRSEPAESMGTEVGLSARESRLRRLRAEACDLFLLFERALTRGDITAGHVDALAMAIRDLNDEQRFGLADREERLLAAASRMRVDDFVRHCRIQAADVVAELARVAAAPSSDEPADHAAAGAPTSDPAASSTDGLAPSSVDPQLLEYLRQRDESKVRRWRDADSGMCLTLVALDPIRDAVFKRAFDAHLNALRADGSTSAMPWRQVEVEAFLRMVAAGVRPTASRSTIAGDDGSTLDLSRLRVDASAPVVPKPVSSEANVPEICVVASLDRLLDDCCSRGLCETGDGQALAAATLRRMLCDSLVYPAVLGGDGEVLDLGRTRRTVNRAQRRALRAMHRTCGHPGCTVPFESCRIHHVRWWNRDHGPTDLANMLPLCEVHHHLVHEGGWTLTMTPDRVATWIRPDGTHWTTAATADRAADLPVDEQARLCSA